MKNLLIVTILLFGGGLFAQTPFSNCSAILLNDQMLVPEYAAAAKCKVSADEKGWLSAGTVTLGDVSKGEKKFETTQKFNFGVAIKDGETGTITTFSQKTFMKIELEKVLAQCKKGDSIIIMTTEKQYALPHNDILVY